MRHAKNTDSPIYDALKADYQPKYAAPEAKKEASAIAIENPKPIEPVEPLKYTNPHIENMRHLIEGFVG